MHTNQRCGGECKANRPHNTSWTHSREKTTSTNYNLTEEDLTLPIGVDDGRLAIPIPAKLVKPIKEGHNEQYEQRAFPCRHRWLVEPLVILVRRDVLSRRLRIALVIRARVQGLIPSPRHFRLSMQQLSCLMSVVEE